MREFNPTVVTWEKQLGAPLRIQNFFTGGAKALFDPMKRAMEGFIGSFTGVFKKGNR